MRTTIHIDNRAYSKETLLLDLECLYWLQVESIKRASTPSQLINKMIFREKEEDEQRNG